MVNKSRARLAIVIPVFNDWQPLGVLLRRLREHAANLECDLHLFIVDDCSTETPSADFVATSSQGLASLRVIRLWSNLGHQRAIAVGLVVASQTDDQLQAVVVMDADGQDRPEDVLKLVEAWNENSTRVVVAHRGERSESSFFKLSYAIYKLTFRALTGQKIDFGNFCLIPEQYIRSLTFDPLIWNNLAAAIARSDIPRTGIVVARQSRFTGKSQMSLKDLVLHGVSAIAVYADVVFLRVLIGAGVLAGMVLLALAGVVTIRLGTNWAIPGWASYLVASLLIILLQAFLISAIALFQLLSLKSIKAFIPALDAMSYVSESPKLTAPIAAHRPTKL